MFFSIGQIDRENVVAIVVFTLLDPASEPTSLFTDVIIYIQGASRTL